MNAHFPVVLAAALLSAAIATMPADAAPRKKNTRALAAVPPAASVAQPPTDRFLACDVRVRDYLREGGAAIRVTKIEVDDARLQLNIHHEYGEAGKSPRKYLRGDTEEEMRKNLRGTLDEFAAAAKAATDGRAWYVIAARKVMPDSARVRARPQVRGRRSSSRISRENADPSRSISLSTGTSSILN